MAPLYWACRNRVGETYQVEVSETFWPFRRDALFLPVTEVPIQPLLNALSFIPDSRGLFEISAEDFALIAAAIGFAEIM